MRNITKLKNYLKRHGDVLVYVLLMSPFLCHEIKQVLMFGIFHIDMETAPVGITVMFAYFTFLHNKYKERGILFIQLRKIENYYYIEVSNAGSYPIYNAQLAIRIDADSASNEIDATFFDKFKGKKFNLKQGDVRLIRLDKEIEKYAVIIIQSNYHTKGLEFKETDTVSINDLDIWD